MKDSAITSVLALLVLACTAVTPPSPSPAATPTAAQPATSTGSTSPPPRTPTASQPATEGPTATPGPTPAPSPTATPDAGWVVQAFENNGFPNHLVIDGDQLWALGDNEGPAAMWNSPNSKQWRLIDGLDADGVTDLVRGDSGYVAVGCSYGRTDTCHIPLAWHSGDGGNWHRVVLPTPDNNGFPNRVAFAFGRYIVLGNECVRHTGLRPTTGIVAALQPAPAECPYKLTIWSSIDGESWISTSPIGLDSFAYPRELFSSGDSLSMVVYHNADTVFLRSRNGIDWAVSQTITSTAIWRVTAIDSGFVAVSSDQLGIGVLRSADAETWQQLGHLPLSTGEFVLAFSRTPSGLVLFTSNEFGETAVRTSVDGSAWIANPLPDPVRFMYVTDAIAFGGNVVAVGNGQIAWHPLPLP